MEFMEGGSLAVKLAGDTMPVRDAAQLVQTLAGAVHAAHQQRIIHRDLKPGNVLLNAKGTPKISDFGLAKLLDAPQGETHTGDIMGTPSYMAPEQAEGKLKDIGPLTDVYALGAILYEALTGRAPFTAATKLATLEQVRTTAPIPPTHRRREVPRDLEAVCLKCLAKQPSQRYLSAEALEQDLGRWLRGEPTLARPAAWYMRVWRRVPRRAIPALLLIFGMVTAIAVYPRLSRELPIRSIEARLARGQTVTLIGETGNPTWSPWRTGGNWSQIATASDGAFTIHTRGWAMLELVRDPQVERYRFRAEVRHEDGGDGGEAGLFVALKTYPIGPDMMHFYVRLAYDDIRDLAKLMRTEAPPQVDPKTLPTANPIVLDPRLYAENATTMIWNAQMSALQPQLFKPANRTGRVANMLWRQLILDVTSDGVRGTWDGHDIGRLLARRIEQDTRQQLQFMSKVKPAEGAFLHGIDPQYNARGALGLFVARASASFRRVVIEPVVE
jgi:serine/threonine-protein kinase